MKSDNSALPLGGIQTVYEIDEHTDVVAQYYPQFCTLGVRFDRPTVSGCKKLIPALREIIKEDIMKKYRYRGFGIVSDHMGFTKRLANHMSEYKLVETDMMIGNEHVLVADLREDELWA